MKNDTFFISLYHCVKLCMRDSLSLESDEIALFVADMKSQCYTYVCHSISVRQLMNIYHIRVGIYELSYICLTYIIESAPENLPMRNLLSPEICICMRM